MGLESRNNLLNIYQLKFGKQGLTLAYTNGEIFHFSANYKAFKYWVDEGKKEKAKRKQPEWEPYSLSNPEIFNDLDKLFTGTFNLSLFDGTFKAKDGKNRLLPIIEIDEEQLRNDIYDDILKKNMQFSDNQQWSHTHNCALWVYIQRQRWKYIDDESLKQIREFFNHQFDLNELWKHCNAMGCEWKQIKYK